MYMIVRINNQAPHLMTSQATGAPPSFLGTMFASWLISTKRLFDKHIVSLVFAKLLLACFLFILDVKKLLSRLILLYVITVIVVNFLKWFWFI